MPCTQDHSLGIFWGQALFILWGWDFQFFSIEGILGDYLRLRTGCLGDGHCRDSSGGSRNTKGWVYSLGTAGIVRGLCLWGWVVGRPCRDSARSSGLV